MGNLRLVGVAIVPTARVRAPVGPLRLGVLHEVCTRKSGSWGPRGRDSHPGGVVLGPNPFPGNVPDAWGWPGPGRRSSHAKEE